MVIILAHREPKGTKMRQKDTIYSREAGEKTVRDIKRRTRRHVSAIDKIWIVLLRFRGEVSIAEIIAGRVCTRICNIYGARTFWRWDRSAWRAIPFGKRVAIRSVVYCLNSSLRNFIA